jgi:hypothetical protein
VRVDLLRKFGKLLMKNRMRESEAKKYMAEADELESKLKPWLKHSRYIYMPEI